VQIGRDWQAEVLSVDRKPQPAQLTLAVGAGDRERFSWLVEKSVELGVTDVIPIESAHTSGVSTRIKNNHLGRLRRSSLEVLKQCGSPWVPTIHAPVPLAHFVQQPPNGIGWLAEQSGAVLPASLDGRALTILVGPEGGFTEAERAAIIGAGYQSVSLGRYTLRFETAALVAAAAASQARLRGAHA
jgi:16S rRNA (uracil1498-N3)-methyltransferase